MVMQAFYDERMNAGAGGPDLDVFIKARLLKDYCGVHGIPVSWCAITPVAWKDWDAIHDPSYVAKVRHGDPAVFEAACVPVSTDMIESLGWNAGSFTTACIASLECGRAFSPTAHFHHAHYAGPGVFCLLNGLVLAARSLRETNRNHQVLILDGDYHYGNGTDDILSRITADGIDHISLGRRFTRPHQRHDYRRAIELVASHIRRRRYTVVLYQAGMDVLRGDPAGGGILTRQQATERDRTIFQACHDASIPITWNMAGGYSLDSAGTLAPTLSAYCSTLLTAMNIYGDIDDGEYERHRGLWSVIA
jgi:acetoin utilization deacetylase AcuC-like enzyme